MTPPEADLFAADSADLSGDFGPPYDWTFLHGDASSRVHAGSTASGASADDTTEGASVATRLDIQRLSDDPAEPPPVRLDPEGQASLIAPSAVGEEHPDAEAHARDRDERDRAAWDRGEGAPELDAVDARGQPGFEPGEPDPERIRAQELDPRSAAAITPRRVKWLWPGYVPLGKVTTLDGRPGVAKSAMTLDIAARVTRGRAMPDGSPGVGPANVIVITAEDDWEDTVVPRLIGAGADLERVFRVDDLSLPDGIDALREEMEELDVRLIVIDPLMAFVPVKYNLFRDQDSRVALKPFAVLMAENACAAMALRHVTKMQGIPAQDKGTGSVAIGGAARSNLIAGADPDRDGGMVLAAIKSNLARKPPSLSYRVESRTVETEDGPSEVPVITWGDRVDVEADDLVAAEKQGEAARFLLRYLADGPRPVKDVKAAAEAEGLSWTGAVRRASERLNILKYTPEVGKQGVGWYWALPDGAST